VSIESLKPLGSIHFCPERAYSIEEVAEKAMSLPSSEVQNLSFSLGLQNVIIHIKKISPTALLLILKPAQQSRLWAKQIESY